jgi:SAM-dependent methyltransferase
VAEVTRATHTVGLDASTSFLALAAGDAPPGVEFTRHDVTRTPFPGAPADLLYARLLLAHLPDPAALVGRWTSQLTPGGRLLVDDLEWIEPRHPVLAAYEEIVVALVASRGAAMYVGPVLDALDDGPGWRRSSSTVRAVPVSTGDAARMFAMNVRTWRDDPFIRDEYPRARIDRLAAELDALTSSAATGDITWGMRQLVYERTRGPAQEGPRGGR